MPSGVLLVAERTVTLAGTIQPTPQRILDVGAGYGKHGVLLREYLDPTPTVHGVEAWEPYVKAHRLEGSDVIELHYCAMNATTGSRHSGGSATIGVENVTGSEGVSISFDTAGAVSTGSGFRLTPP